MHLRLCSIILGLATSIAHAQPIPDFTIFDGNSEFTLGGLMGQRLTANGGTGGVQVPTPPSAIDHLFQNWFWYRSASDSREYALSNMVTSTGSTSNQITLIYSEPVNNGATAGALFISVRYTINDLPPVQGKRHAQVRMELTCTNVSNSNLIVHIYNYNDMDLNGGSGGDSSAVGGTNSRYVQSIFDSAIAPRVQASYVGSSANFLGFNMFAFPALRDILTDNAANQLTNSPLTFGPGDYTGAMEWSNNLQANGGQMQVTVTLDILVAKCPADLNSDAAVGPADLAQLLATWGICPP